VSFEAHSFETPEGAKIAYRDLGDPGQRRPVLLLHGYIADAVANWIRPGVAQALIDAGFRVVMPDLRGHGASVISHDPADFPPDAYARDQLALLEALGIEAYDLVGYSLGAQVAARVQALDGRARSLVLAGSGEDSILERDAHWGPFLAALADPSTRKKGLRAILDFVDSVGGDCRALLLSAECRETTSHEQLGAFRCRTLLLSGSDDEIESLEPFRELIPGARTARTPGDHVTAVSHPDFARAIVGFLRGEEER
jgi:pimeloyl-ACP methyl ester carboxylesterase